MTQEKKSFDRPDETNQPVEKITIDTVELGGKKVVRVTAQPGWKWSVDLQPLFGTDSCQVDHLLYMTAGHMTVRSDDGDEQTYGPGDLAHIPPGHDGWDSMNEVSSWIELPH